MNNNHETETRLIPELLSKQERSALIRRVTAVQRATRMTISSLLAQEEASGPQVALAYDSLHVGPLGIGEERGPCVYFVGKGRCVPHDNGFCTSCGYNFLPLPKIDEIPWLKSQFANYQESMTSWQKGIDQTEREDIWIPAFEKKLSSGPRVVIVTGFLGSFLSNAECSPSAREWLLKSFIGDFEDRSLSPQVYFEVRAEDVIRARNDHELEKLAPFFKILSARFILGFESSDDFVRNVIYCKGLGLNAFENAVRTLQEVGFGTNAFVFLGNHSMGDTETLADVQETLYYLKEKNTPPVIMTPSITPASLNAVLKFAGKYRYPDPRTYLEILRTAIRLFPFDPNSDHYPFMTSLGGGPPTPPEWMMDSPDMSTCTSCAEKIKLAARKFLYNFDQEEFAVQTAAVDLCPCYNRYRERLEEEKSWPPLISRVRQNVALAEKYKDDYIRYESSHH